MHGRSHHIYFGVFHGEVDSLVVCGGHCFGGHSRPRRCERNRARARLDFCGNSRPLTTMFSRAAPASPCTYLQTWHASCHTHSEHESGHASDTPDVDLIDSLRRAFTHHAAKSLSADSDGQSRLRNDCSSAEYRTLTVVALSLSLGSVIGRYKNLRRSPKSAVLQLTAKPSCQALWVAIIGRHRYVDKPRQR